MLETSEERIKLLKQGFTCKDIEHMYVKNNNLRIIRFSILKELAESGRRENKNTVINNQPAAGFTPGLCAELV